MFKQLIESIREAVSEAVLAPWKTRPSNEKLKGIEKQLKTLGATRTTERKVLLRGPFKSDASHPDNVPIKSSGGSARS